MEKDTAIQVENLGKKYIIGHQTSERYTALRDVIAEKSKSLFKREFFRKSSSLHFEEFWALSDINFEIKRGERVGIVGRNGAGKSTLLKLISRITDPTIGRISIRGRVASLLEVGTGFHPELSGRENIFLNGAILGMTRSEIKRKFDEIVAFAEIEKFLDTPVKRYSSGMYVRLAFAVAAHLEPEVLIVDEVLAVGDSQFQKKCMGKMEEVSKNDGRTVVFVSHNMSALKALCPKSILLEQGKLKQVGETDEIIRTYLSNINNKPDGASVEFTENLDKEFQLRSFKLENLRGEITNHFECNDPIQIFLTCQVNQKIPGLYGYLTLSREDGTIILESDTFDKIPNKLDELEIGDHKFRIIIPPRVLGHGKYFVYFNFTSQSGIKGFNIDSPGIVSSFELSDNSTIRGNRRNGYVSTILNWELLNE